MTFPRDRYIYPCPHGCLAQRGQPIAATIQGWKAHMSRRHGGYTTEQLDAIVGASKGLGEESETGRLKFLSEVDGSPEPAMPKGQADSKAGPVPIDAPRTVPIDTSAVSKKFSGRLNKLKRSIAETLPKVLNEAIKEKGEEWQMDGGEADMLAEAVEACFDALDIEFRIVPFQTVLTNPLWVLVLPALVLVMIFSGKAIKNAPRKQQGENVPEGSDTNEPVTA